jgi:hypothetical protein
MNLQLFTPKTLIMNKIPNVENEIAIIFTSTNEIIHRLENGGIELSAEELEKIEQSADKLLSISSYMPMSKNYSTELPF